MLHSFWVRTHNLIRAHKISQEKFALLVGIKYNTFRCWKYNSRIPDAESACNIADALGVSVEYLVRGGDRAKARQKLKQVKERVIASGRIKKLVLKLEEQAMRLQNSL